MFGRRLIETVFGSLMFVPLSAGSQLFAGPSVEIIAGDIAPYVYEDAKTGIQGTVATVVAEMARRVGHSGQIELVPWARAQQMVRDFDDKNTKKTSKTSRESIHRMILPLTWTEERKNQYIWIAEILADDLVVVGLRPQAPGRSLIANVKSIDELKALKIGVLLGSPGEEILRDRGFAAVDASVSEEANARKLNLGRIDGWVVARTVAPYAWNREHLPSREFVYGPVVRTNHLWLAASKNTPEQVVKLWRDALDSMKADGSYSRLINAQK